MRKSLGSKRKELSKEDIATITRLFGGFVEKVAPTARRIFDHQCKKTFSRASTHLGNKRAAFAAMRGLTCYTQFRDPLPWISS
jgi:type I restriction-modification system DNA methylase subunit